MGVFWQRGQRRRRLPGRLLGEWLNTRYGAAEGALAAVAVVLVVWLLWPEENGPRLDQRATWQQSVEEAERRRAELEAARAENSTFQARSARVAPPAVEEPPRRATDLPERPDRRRLAKPSELADRLDEFESAAFEPAPARPAGAAQPAIGAELLLGSETVPAIDPGAPAEDDGDGPPFEVAALSGETPEIEPLPEVDLTDLDTLVPAIEMVEPAPVAPRPEAIASDEAISDNDAFAPSADAAIGPDGARPATDVRLRPRDDAPTWLKNAVTAAVADERPIIAVVIDDLGLNRPKTAELNDLPAPLTLSFLPYAGRIEAQTEAAQAAGHELMLHLPMEPVGSDWPGPDALTTRIDEREFALRLQKNLSRFRGFVGINNHMGSRLTADGPRMDVVMRELRKRDVLFLDSKTSARSVAGDFAERNGVPNTNRDVFLDHVIDPAAIRRQLALTEKIALREGSAVAIGHPHGTTIAALREWLPTLESRGFTLAPISAVVARRACGSGVLIAAETCGRYLQARSPANAVVATGG